MRYKVHNIESQRRTSSLNMKRALSRIEEWNTYKKGSEDESTTGDQNYWSFYAKSYTEYRSDVMNNTGEKERSRQNFTTKGLIARSTAQWLPVRPFSDSLQREDKKIECEGSCGVAQGWVSIWSIGYRTAEQVSATPYIGRINKSNVRVTSGGWKLSI